MSTILDDLKREKNNLTEYKDITIRALGHMANVVTRKIFHNDYVICYKEMGSSRRTARPLNTGLFIESSGSFEKEFVLFTNILDSLKKGKRTFSSEEYNIIDKVTYTIQQSFGVCMDLEENSNRARKLVGMGFEELIKHIFNYLEISNRKIILNIPYGKQGKREKYSCEIEIVLSPFEGVKSTNKYIHKDEIVFSLKTTTKDRMSKIFVDKILMTKFLGTPVKLIGVSVNDIQRKEEKTQSTFTSGLFMVYTEILTPLEGYYYLDVPKIAVKAPFNKHIFQFSKLIIDDLWNLLGIS